ncbi:MAG: glycosyltransferase [Alphaproteobacteria bacterium]
MMFCDITTAYNENSGGIRTYIDEKRRHLLEHTNFSHLLIVPGKEDREETQGRSTTVYVGSPLLPTQDTYRFFLRPARIREALVRYRPDVIELGSYYLEPWAAFAYRRRCREEGRTCVIGGYFHTDVAAAYVSAPLRAVAHDWFDDWSDTLAEFGVRLADIAKTRAERYVGKIFRHCDIALAASPAQAERLREYGVERIKVVPLGVDLQIFHPRHRSDQMRARYGADAETTVLIYAGRLSTEKSVLTLVEALERLPGDFKAMLWMVGEGPLHDRLHALARRNPAIRLLPYQEERSAFARLLASADVYVTAGQYETFALSVIEAQACGLPVVGVDAGALRERVPEGLGFLGPVEDAGAMAENILCAVRQRAAIGARARAHVERHFSWDSALRTLIECYRTEQERHMRPPPVFQPQGG